MLENFEKITKEIDAAQKIFQEKSIVVLRDAIKEMFEAFPFLKKIKWCQCYFGIQYINYAVEPENQDDAFFDNDDEDNYCYLYNLKLKETDKVIFNKFEKNIYQISDYLETAFGEATIVATKNELEISESPEHD